MGRWIFTPRRKASLKKAQKVHVEMVEAGRSLVRRRKQGRS